LRQSQGSITFVGLQGPTVSQQGGEKGYCHAERKWEGKIAKIITDLGSEACKHGHGERGLNAENRRRKDIDGWGEKFAGPGMIDEFNWGRKD